MENNFLPVDCWILDEIETDFTAMWDIVSVLSQRQPQLSIAAIYAQISQRLSWLFKRNYFLVYEGVDFNGDEMSISVNFSSELIKTQAEEWKNTDSTEKQIKIYITDLGRKLYLENCHARHFTGIATDKTS